MVREHLPRFFSPMLARSGTSTDAEAWAYEVKFDDMRAQLRLDRGKLCLRSRPGRDCTEAFPELARLAAPRDALAVARRRARLLERRRRPGLRSSAREGGFGGQGGAPRGEALARHVSRLELLHLDRRSTRELSYAERVRCSPSSRSMGPAAHAARRGPARRRSEAARPPWQAMVGRLAETSRRQD
jgi:bifunctional non-homologous end joining protein LigD